MENKLVSVNEEEMVVMSILEEDAVNTDMLCHVLGCA